MIARRPEASSRFAPPGRDRATTIESLLLGDSPAMRRVRWLVAKLAPTTLPVLVHGPTGSGKELVAQALHALSGRDGRLVGFNVCAIAESLFESALFGHVRGAFTGAARDTDGLLLEAHRGTAFFDEIGSLPVAAQAKLLRAIETREFRPVGGGADRTSEFRTVAATNDELGRLVESGRFREDLLYRLSGAVIEVPALDERREDVPLLAAHFAARACGSRADRTTADAPDRAAPITESALERLAERRWPGNVRELRTVVECAAALSTSPTISATAIEDALLLRGGRSARERTARRAGQGRALLDALDAHAGDVDAVAADLGVHRATVYRRLQRATGGGRPADGARGESTTGS